MTLKTFDYNANSVCMFVVPVVEFHGQNRSNCKYLLDELRKKTADHLSTTIIDLAIVNLTRLLIITRR